MIRCPDIDLGAARPILDAGIAKAEEIGCRMDVAVVGAGGNLKAFARMDGAWLGSIDIAVKKARAARSFDMDSGGRVGGLVPERSFVSSRKDGRGSGK